MIFKHISTKFIHDHHRSTTHLFRILKGKYESVKLDRQSTDRCVENGRSVLIDPFVKAIAPRIFHSRIVFVFHSEKNAIFRIDRNSRAANSVPCIRLSVVSFSEFFFNNSSRNWVRGRVCANSLYPVAWKFISYIFFSEKTRKTLRSKLQGFSCQLFENQSYPQ